MARYQLTQSGDVVLRSDGASIPSVAANADYQEYLVWVAAGNTPDPAAPRPVVYSGLHQIDARLRTTNATSTELYRATLAPLTGYRAALTLIAVDAGNGAVRTIEARITAKRLNAGAALVGGVTIVADQQDPGTAAWAITPSVAGNDFVISVAGAAGRTINWLLSGHVTSFTPGGKL